jgi:hypothetical protein
MNERMNNTKEIDPSRGFEQVATELKGNVGALDAALSELMKSGNVSPDIQEAFAHLERRMSGTDYDLAF